MKIRKKDRKKLEDRARDVIEHFVDDPATVDYIRRLMVEKATALVTPQWLDAMATELHDHVLGRVANDEELLRTVRALAGDIATDQAKAYIAHVLGWRLTIEVGTALAGLEPVVPPNPA